MSWPQNAWTLKKLTENNDVSDWWCSRACNVIDMRHRTKTNMAAGDVMRMKQDVLNVDDIYAKTPKWLTSMFTSKSTGILFEHDGLCMSF